MAEIEPAKRATLARLRAAVARLEGASADARAAPAVPLGLAALDAHLPQGGIPRGRMHEVAAADQGAAALGVALWFVSRLCDGGRPWLWCGQEAPYGPALPDFGLPPDRLILARCRDSREILWAAEEGLAAPALGAVLIEAAAVGATAARRLALAARESGVAAILLRPRGEAAPLAADTRWRVTGAPGDAWDLALLRARGAPPRTWRIAWRGAGLAPLLLLDVHENRDDHGRNSPGSAGAGALAAASAGGTA